MKTAVDLIRRGFYYWQFLAAFVLPVWLLVGWGVFGGSGWGYVGLLIAAPLVFVALLVIALIVFARPAVRRSRAVSWWDVALYTVLHGSVVGLGFFGPTTTPFLVLGIVATIAGFWLALWELVSDGARSMRETMDAFEQAARGTAPAGPQGQGGSADTPPRAPGQGPGDDPEVIVIHEVRD